MSDPLAPARDLAKSGRYGEALAAFRQHSGAEAAYGEGACHFKLNDHAAAREALGRALAADPFHAKSQALLDQLPPVPIALAAKPPTGQVKTKKKSNPALGCLLALILFAGFVGAIHSCMDSCWNELASPQPGAAAPEQPSPAEKAKQPERWELIQKLINADVFMKVEKSSGLTRVSVGRAWYDATFDQKEHFINVVYAYYITEDPQTDLVIVIDGYSGKEIGKYAAVYGGLKVE